MCREDVKKPKSKSPEQALSSLMRTCARAERSSGDARKSMARWAVDPSAREGILQKLIADKFIDDERYSRAYIREKTNLSGWGSRKIAAALRAKGIATEIFSPLLADLDKDSLAERLSAKLTRKATTVKGESTYEKRGKLLRYGLSLGYDYQMVMDSIEQINFE